MSHKIDYKLASTEQIIEDLGKRIALIRLTRNISQNTLAERAGLTRRTLSRLETGKGATLETWIRVMRSLGLENDLEACLPDPGIQPVQDLAGGKRQRARPGTGPERGSWHWDEDEAP